MNPEKNIDEKLRNLGNAIGSDKNIVNNVMSRIKAEPTIKNSKTKNQNIWRNIMKSPISKLAAAAILIIAVIIGFNNFQLTSPAYGITDVSQILLSSRTLHVKGWLCANVQPGLYDPNIVKPGQIETRGLMENWIDMETGKTKITHPGNVIVKDDKFHISHFTRVYDGEFQMTINSESKTVSFMKFNSYYQLLKKKKNNASILMNLLSILNSSDLYQQIGEEKIGEQVFEIFQAEYNLPFAEDQKRRIKLWFNPDNGHIGKAEGWTKIENMDWFQEVGIDQIEYNLPIPSGIFSTEVPEGYTSTNTKETADTQKLFQNFNYIWYDQNDGRTSQNLTSYACFTLNDGSVILCWSSTIGITVGNNAIEPESDKYQEEIFEKIMPGQQLPKLSFVFYTISPINDNPQTEYLGRHLTYTKKDNIFHEWSIFVPEIELEKYYGQLDYNLHYKSNIENIVKEGACTLGEIGDIQIENEDDFNTFVLGAMVELSDDGKAPEGVTYEEVLRLAQEIRESSAK